MTEEERIRDNELNPRIVTNQQNKGKMKFLMKYYHRGAFYIDKEEDILKVCFTFSSLLFSKCVLYRPGDKFTFLARYHGAYT
jgi:hypothetical protein